MGRVMGENRGVDAPSVEAGDALNHNVEATHIMTTPIGKRTPSPAFQLYAKEFLSSSKVRRMSNTELGIYIKLLLMSWLDGSLPSDISVLADMVDVPVKQFSRLWPHVLTECFTERSGRLVNERLEVERKKQTDYRRRQTDRAKSRWESQRTPNARNAPAMPRHSQGPHSQGNASHIADRITTVLPNGNTSVECSEASSEPPVLTFTTVGQQHSWGLSQAQVDRWAVDFPHVDILAECRKARSWVDAKPERRKTAKGMPAFLVGWLGRSNDRGTQATFTPSKTSGNVDALKRFAARAPEAS